MAAALIIMVAPSRRDELLTLFDLADRKGHDVTQSTMRDHVRLIDGEGNRVALRAIESGSTMGNIERTLAVQSQGSERLKKERAG